MKMIIAIVASYRMENVIEELNKIQVYRKTISNVLGVGQSHKEVYRGLVETGDLIKKVRFEIAVADDRVEAVINAFAAASEYTDQDGKIFVMNIEECIQMGTGKRGSEAVGQ